MKCCATLLGILLLCIGSPVQAMQGGGDSEWRSYGETAEGDLIELYGSSAQRESGKNIVTFTYRLTEKNGEVRTVKARSTDCFKGSESWSLNGRPRRWAIRKDGQWKSVKITSDATINLLINVCRLAQANGYSEVKPATEGYTPEVADSNSLGYMVSDADYEIIYATACRELRSGDRLSSVRATIWVRLVDRSNISFDRARVERETGEILGIVARDCYR